MVTLEVRSLDAAPADFAAAWKTGRSSVGPRIAFESPELLWKVLTAKRWELLKAMCGAGSMSIREAARRTVAPVEIPPPSRMFTASTIRLPRGLSPCDSTSSPPASSRRWPTPRAWPSGAMHRTSSRSICCSRC
jgi:hypothetical protein